MLVVYGLLALSFVLLVVYLTRDRKHLPPGPPLGIPILGNLLSICGKSPHEKFAQLAWKYGPVCGLRMGSVYTVLLSDPKLVRHLFAKDIYSGRAPLYLTHGMMNGYGLIAAEGEMWKEHRKFVSGYLKNTGMVKFSSPKRDKIEEKIIIAVTEALEKLEARSNEGEGLAPYHTLHHCIGNLLNNLIFGIVYEEEDELWKWLQLVQQEGLKYIAACSLMDFLPFLRFLPHFVRAKKSLTDGQKRSHEIYRKILEDHRKCPKDMNSLLAVYNQEMKRREANGESLGSFTETQCFYLLADIYGAGVHTTLMTIQWILLFMAAFPEEQAKIQEEIDKVVDQREPTLEDRPALTRMEAAIMEVQRLRSVVPIGIPHGTTEDTRIENYDIPKGSMIIPLQYAIHMNPSYWPDPYVFKPERFIAEVGSLSKPDAFLPFQIGKRMCVGDEFARMTLFLFVSRILHRFTLSAPLGHKIDLDGEFVTFLVPKMQNLIFKRRR